MKEDDRVELVKRLVTLSYRLSRCSKITLGAEDCAEHSADLRTAAALLALQGADTVTEAGFDREGFQRRASAILKDDIARNGRITPDGIAMIGAEAEFYARRRTAAPTAQDDTGARLDAVWDELQSLLPQSGVGAELQSAWDKLRSLLAAQNVGGISAGR